MNVNVTRSGLQSWLKILQKGEDGPSILTEAAAGEPVEIGCDENVEIDKMYGPLIFWPIRVRAEFETCEWVVERLFGEDEEWRVVARVPGQLESDFDEEVDDL